MKRRTVYRKMKAAGFAAVLLSGMLIAAPAAQAKVWPGMFVSGGKVAGAFIAGYKGAQFFGAEKLGNWIGEQLYEWLA